MASHLSLTASNNRASCVLVLMRPAMTARRQSSTTSLARFVRDEPADIAGRSTDFCNSFWGAGDGGVDVLFARVRGASRTMEEVRAFWRERYDPMGSFATYDSPSASRVLTDIGIAELLLRKNIPSDWQSLRNNL